MSKLSCGVIILTVGLMGNTYAQNSAETGDGAIISSVPDLQNDLRGGGVDASASRAKSEQNANAQNSINTQLMDGVNVAGKRATEALKQADQATTTANNAFAAASQAVVTSGEAAKSAAQAATSAGKAVDTANRIENDLNTAKADMATAKSTAEQANTTAKAAETKAQSAVDTVNTYKGEINDRVSQFEQTTNTNIQNFQQKTNETVTAIHNEVGEVRESIQGAIHDSATALIRSTHAEEVAVEANLTAKRVEDGLAQEIVDRRADVERGIDESKAYTDSKFKDFTDQIEKTKKFAAAGAASALAASQIPQVSQGSAFSLGVGMGNYSGQSALSLGMSARMGDYTVTKIAFTTDSMSNVGGGVGIAVEW